MKAILTALAGGLLIGALAASHAKLPPPTEEEKAAAAAKKEKEAAEKAEAAKDLGRAQDRAVENYRRNRAAAKPSGQAGPGGQAGASASGSTAPAR